MGEEQDKREENSRTLISKEDGAGETIPSPEIIKPTETQISTQDISTSLPNMEVHHHPNVEKKNFKEYFLEFVMIFLAVTIGFFAENIREHKVEEERAKEFATLMIEDLKKDTSFFRTGSEKFLMIEKHQDSVLALLHSGFEKASQYDVIKHWINGVWALNFSPHQATYEQMKNSGALRYIKNIRLINSMQQYYNTMLPSIAHYHDIQSELTERRMVPFLEDHINYQEADFLYGKMNISNPIIFDWNKRTAIKLYNMMDLLKEQNQYLNSFYTQGKGDATTLILLLQNEYHLN
jgi:hypothetical protein